MRHFCTYFDLCYLPKGLALHDSLRQQCPEFTLWVLCLDSGAHEMLLKLALEDIRPISFEDFIHGDHQLQAARSDRSLVEFYFTCSPSLPLYIFRQELEVDMITYLDADLYFFSSPEPIFEEMGDRSIAITPHRYPVELIHNNIYGLYNVGWLSFRRDEIALACLNWWRDRCLEWCCDREEDGKFADQKYLDQWPELFGNVAVLKHLGVNVAAWNLSGTKFCHSKGFITVDNQPLIFYHYHSIKKISHIVYEMAFNVYRVKPSYFLRRRVLAPYLRRVREFEEQLGMCSPRVLVTGGIRSRTEIRSLNCAIWRRSASRIKRFYHLIRGVTAGDYFFYIGRHIL
jgi:hypothetical protein